MAQTIRIKRSSVSGKTLLNAPTHLSGELGFNSTDKKIWLADTDTTQLELLTESSTNVAQDSTFSTTTGFIKSDGDGTYSVDTSTYLTSGDLSGYLLNTTDTLTGDLTVTGNLDSTNFKTIDSSIAISADNSALVLDDGSANLNIGIGIESLKNAVTASKNVCIGPYTGRYITGASLENVFIGYLSGGAYRVTAADTTGSNNVGIGKTALGKITSGDRNIALGLVAGENMTAGDNNIALGTQALNGATAGVTGNRNIVLGYQCGYDVTSASDNILIGTNSGTQLSTGLNNIFIGIHSGESDISTNVTGDENISFGSYSLSSITSGSYNIALGQNAGKNLTTENNQLRIGNIDVDVTDKGLIEGDLSLETVTINGDLDATGTLDVQTLGSTIKAGSNTLKFAQNAVDATTGNLGVGSNMHLDAPTAGQLYLNYYGGTGGVIFGDGATNVVAKVDSSGKIYSFNTTAQTLSTDGALTLGSTSSINLALDTNDVQARNNGANSALYLNRLGGNVSIGESGTTTDSHTLHGKTTINLIDTVVDSAFSGVKINHTLSGSDVTTADKNHIGFHVNTSSTASGGDTANEHRIYGTYSTVTASGDSDLIWGGYSRGISTLGNTGETVSLVGGITATGQGYNTDGTVSNVYGIQGLSYNDNAGVVTNMYGLYGKATTQSTAGTTSTAMGLYAELEATEGGAVITNGYGIRSVIDNNVTTSPESAIGTSYLFHGDYQGTIPTNAYGIYIDDAVDNHLGGDLNINGHTDVYTISGNGKFETTGQVIAGLGGGSVALTINDGYGNANVAFNHASGVPEQDGSSARIDVNVDSTTAQMDFSIKDNTVADTAVGLTTIVGLNTTSIALNKATTVTGNFTATGDIVFSGLSASTGDILKYDGAKWVAGNSEVTNHDFDATAGQTVFTCAYNIDDVEVYVDGIKLRAGASYDYTATNGTSVTLTQAQDLNTWVQVVSR